MKNYSENTSVESIVSYIQTALSGLSRINGAIPRVNPDGVYGRETEEAVRSFQRCCGLAETGRVDYNTFTQLAELYREAGDAQRRPAAIAPFCCRLSLGRVVPSDKFDLVRIIQIMLNAVSVLYDFSGVDESGIYDERTAAAVREFQKVNNLSVSGIVDLLTWNALAGAYNKCTDSE